MAFLGSRFPSVVPQVPVVQTVAPRAHLERVETLPLCRRRALIMGGIAAAAVSLGVQPSSAAPVAPTDVDTSQSPFVKELLARSEQQREERLKKRLDDYNRRNFSDYLDFAAGSVRADGQMSDNDKAIREWLKANKQ